MDLEQSPADLAFREEVTQWVRDNLDPKIRAMILRYETPGRDEHLAWWRKLAEKGWMVPSWPVEHGGTGWSPMRKHIFEEVMAIEGAPDLAMAGVKMIGPILAAFGSDEQKAFYLPRIRNGEDYWCQGFSEPGAGSDLAALRTRAELDGEEWVINGQKIWTSMAHFADRIFVLVRTEPDARPQSGISMILADMATPGITVRPIKMIDGHDFTNEVFFDNVRVPAANLVGERGKGWAYAKFLLGNERSGLIRTGPIKQQLRHLREVARLEIRNGRPLIEDPVFGTKIAAVEAEAIALEISTLRLIVLASGSVPGTEASLLKIKSAAILQQISALAMQAAGPAALPLLPHGNAGDWSTGDHPRNLAQNYIDMRKASIYGGSSEVQRNIVAKATLGL